MQLNTLRALYEHELHDIQDAESQLSALLPRLAKAATDEELQKQFRAHGELSRVHQERVDSILDALGSKSDDVKCEGIRGISREAEAFLGSVDIAPAVRDAGLLAVGQKIEHYEMAGYGALRTYAQLLGEKEAEGTLQKTLDEEGRADDLLTRIAQKSVNEAANA
jgi:ferritin-like metal-binding protein YciE